MNMSEEYIDMFEAYSRGELNEAEVQAFDARLSYDAEFSEAYARFRKVESGIQEHYRNELKHRFQELDKTLDDQSKGTPRIRKLIWTGASFAAVLLIGLIVYYQSEKANNYEELAKLYWSEEEGLPVKMSTAGKYDAAMNAYKTENWPAAESELMGLLPSDTAVYFLGVVSFERGNYNEAIEHFKTVRSDSKWANESDFRLALSYLSIGEKSRAKSILIRMNQTPNGEFQSEIREILRQI